MEVIRTQRSDIERWRNVDGYSDYEVSNWGRLRNKRSGRFIKFCKGFGMRRIILHRGKDYTITTLASIVLEAFVCKRPTDHKPFCLDGNYEHCYVENLTWVARKRNKYSYSRRYKYRQRIHKNRGHGNKGDIETEF